MFENLKWWKLTRDLESSKYEARRAALEELAASDDERAPDLLLALLINEQEDLSLRRLAAESLARKLDARAVRPMVKVLRKMDPTMAGWEPLVKALASMGAPAVKPLMEMLRDDDRSIRIIAIDELGRIGDERAAAPLLPLLLDGDPNMRMAAANALGEIGDARAVPPLLRLLGDPEQGPSNAAKLALQKLNWAPSGMPEFFHHFLATGHIPSTRFPVRSWEEDKVPSLLLGAAQKGGRPKRLRAIALMGTLGDRRFVPHLLEMLKDRSVNSVAATALGQLGDARAVAPLVQALEDRETSKAAAVALGKLRNTAALPVMQRVYQQLTDDAFAVPLAQLGDAGAMSRFIAALQIDSLDKSPRAHITRAHAAEGLGEVGNPAAIEPLLVALRDKKGDVRLAAAAALGKIGDVRAGEPLLAALRSEGAATEAELKGLERITAEAAADIRHRAALVRETAAVAIVRCADADLLDRLTPLLNDPDAEVRVSSARALGDLADRRAAAPLAEALEDEDSDVRFWAAQSLAKLGSARGLDELMEWLEAYDPAEEKQSARKSAKHMTAGRIAAAIHAVGLLAHAPALPLLADQLGSHTAELRMAAVEAIAVILRRSAARVQLEGLQALAKLDFPTIYQEPDQFLRFAKLSSEIVHLAAQEIERRERGEPEPESQSADAHEEKLLLTCGCGYEYELSMDFVGRRVRCPNCGEVFAVPAPAE